MKKQGVLLVQMGGPCCIANVEDFLFNLFKDEHIIQLPFFLKPFQKSLAKSIARKRSPEVSELYEKIGGRSPILYETQLQTYALAEKLGSQCFFAMRYSYPYLKDTLPDILNANLDKLVVIPLYPQYSTATTGSNFAECKELFSKSGLDTKIEIEYIESWETNEFFIELWVQRIQEQIEVLINQSETGFHILFSAHGLPEKYVKNGDPYQKQVTSTVDAVIKQLVIARNASDEAIPQAFTTSLSYQSKVGPIKWLEPSTEFEIQRLAQAGVKNLIVVPISFVGDHIETTYEINMLYKELAESKGIKNFLMARALKDDPLLIEALSSLVRNCERSEFNSRHSEPSKMAQESTLVKILVATIILLVLRYI